jgi:hypothetical protein
MHEGARSVAPTTVHPGALVLGSMIAAPDAAAE